MGLTVASALPCHTEILGQGPRCGEASRTRSPHSRAERVWPWNMLSNASGTLVAGREAGDEHPVAIHRLLADQVLDHLPDGMSLAVIALDVAELEPVEAAFRIVDVLLLREEEDEA